MIEFSRVIETMLKSGKNKSKMAILKKTICLNLKTLQQ